MTKKFLFGTMAAATMMFASSCTNDDFAAPTGDESTVSISLDIPQKQMSSRAFGDGTTATKLQYAVYEKTDAGLSQINALADDTEMENLKKTISLKLLNGHTYAFVFWAASEDAPYAVTFAADGASMAATYDGAVSNNENLDAFYAYYEHTVTGDQAVDVPLYRPFAQINIGANDIDEVEKLNYDVKQSTVTVKGSVYSTLDLVTGAVSDPVDAVTFNLADIPDNTKETFPVATYEYVAMNYVLVDEQQDLTEVAFTVTYTADNEDKEVKRTVGSVPVRRNYRTNIYGQLFTNNVDFNVEIKPDFEEPDYEVIALADGVRYLTETNTFEISNAAGLQWVAYQVNAGGANEYVEAKKITYGAPNVAFVDQTIVLTDNIDLQNINWTPIGYETKENGASIYGFAGTFDGKDHTISNLTVSTDKNSNAGLFGATNYATIKNLTLEDVNIEGHYKTAAIVADAWCTTIDKCHVKRGAITSTPWEIKPNVYDDANNVGGTVGYLCGQPDAAAVTNCTVDGVEITAFRKIGGIVGVTEFRKDNYGEPSATITGCTVSNTKITADMTEMRYDGYATRKAAIGEIVGDAKDGTTMEGNTYSDNVTLETKQAEIVGASEAAAAIRAGGSVYLTEDFKFSETSYATMTKTLDLNLGGHKLSSAGGGSNKDAVVVGSGAEVSISNGTIDPPTDALDNGFSTTIVVMSANGGKLTLNDVTVVGNMYPVELRSANADSEIVINSGTYAFTEKWTDEQYRDQVVAVYASGAGKITINGGTFGMKGVYSEFLLNVMDSQRKTDVRDNIEVRGGKFYNFDPSNNRAEGPGTNFVADGYTVVSYSDGDDTVYEVVPN